MIDQKTGMPQNKPALDDVNYRNAGDDGNACANCQYFNAPDQCSLVDGIVSAAGMCDLYTKKADESTLIDQMFGMENQEANAANVPPGGPE